MSKQDTPITEQEPPLSEEKSVSSVKEEQHVRSTTPPPFVPRAQSPYGWPGYYPGTGPQWPGGRQYGPSYGYTPTRRSPWPWIVLTCFLLCILIAAGVFVVFGAFGIAGYTNSVTETQHFSVSAHPTLVLNNDTGSIHVRSVSSGSEITIQATKHSSSLGNLNDIKVNYAQNTDGNTVTVNVDRLNNGSFFGSESVEFDISVPSAATLQLKTNTGSIDVTGVSGQMVLASNTGSVAARDGTLSGTTEMTSNTGSITFNGSLDRNGTYRFETNTGSVNVALPSESAFHLEASTDTGSINTNFPGVTVQHRQYVGADAHGNVGSSPQAMISLRTNTGSIDLYHS